MSDMRKTLSKLAKKIGQPTEATTIASLVLPVINELGWMNPPEFSYVLEEKTKGGKKPDIALLKGDECILGIEAKALNSDLDNESFTDQATNYAGGIKVRWIILTDGLRWDLYDCKDLTEKSAEQMRVFSATLDEAQWDDLYEALSPKAVSSGRLEHLMVDNYLVPIVQERWKELIAELPASLINLLIPPKEIPGYEDLSIRREAVKMALSPGFAVATKTSKPVELPTETSYYLLPVSKRNEAGEAGEKVLKIWLDESHWGLNEGTRYRQRIEPGDRICFYVGGLGVMATAVAAGKATSGKPAEVTRKSDYYLPLSDVVWFKPVQITAELRSGMDIMKGKTAAAIKNWTWLVQGACSLTERDFLRLINRE